MFGIQTHLALVICDSPEDAVAKGFDYKTEKPVEIQQAVIVRNGTESGRSTVDLIIVDEKGNKFVVMLTGSIIQMIAGAV